MVVVREGIPPPEEYGRLLTAVGWSEFVNPMFVSRALEGSLCCVVAEDDGELVGLGRLIGDGASCFYVQDVVIAPDHRGQGIGTRVMDVLLEYLRDHAPPNAMVGVFAARGAGRFFERFGFARRDPDAPALSLFL